VVNIIIWLGVGGVWWKYLGLWWYLHLGIGQFH
jgi:hypothetical protein